MRTNHSHLGPRVAAHAVALFLVLLAAPAAAGPWVEAPGDGYLKLSGEVFDSQRNFDVAGDAMAADPAYSHVGARSYGEVGVAPRLSVGWSVPFVAARNTASDGTRHRRAGFGDLDVRADVQIVRDTCALAGQLEGRIPLYGDTVGRGDSATSADGEGGSGSEPILGDGSRELTPTLAFGCGLPLPGWLTAAAGPNFRFDGFGDGLTWRVGGGAYAIPDRLAIQIGASGLERFRAGNPRPTKRYVKARGGFLVEFGGPWAVEGNASYVLDGAFVAQGWSGSLGVSYDGAIFANPFGERR